MSKYETEAQFLDALDDLITANTEVLSPGDVMRCLIAVFVAVAHSSETGLSDVPVLLKDTEELIHAAVSVILEADPR